MKTGLNTGLKFYKKRKNKLFIFLFITILSFALSAEMKENKKRRRSGKKVYSTISGKVLNQHGEPVPAVVFYRMVYKHELSFPRSHVYTDENGNFFVDKVWPCEILVTILTEFTNTSKTFNITNAQDIVLPDIIVNTPPKKNVILSFIAADGTFLVGSTVFEKENFMSKAGRLPAHFTNKRKIADCKKVAAVSVMLYTNRLHNIYLTKNGKSYMVRPFSITSDVKKLNLTAYPEGRLFNKILRNGNIISNSRKCVKFTHEKTGFLWCMDYKDGSINFNGPEGFYEIFDNRYNYMEAELTVGKTNLVNFQFGSLNLQFSTQVYANISLDLKLKHKNIELSENRYFKYLLERIKQPSERIFIENLPVGNYDLFLNYTTVVQKVSLKAEFSVEANKTTNFKLESYKTNEK